MELRPGERPVSYPLAKPRTWPQPRRAEAERWARRLSAAERACLRSLAAAPKARAELDAPGADFALTRLLGLRLAAWAEGTYTITDTGRARLAALERRTR